MGQNLMYDLVNPGQGATGDVSLLVRIQRGSARRDEAVTLPLVAYARNATVVEPTHPVSVGLETSADEGTTWEPLVDPADLRARASDATGSCWSRWRSSPRSNATRRPPRPRGGPPRRPRPSATTR